MKKSQSREAMPLIMLLIVLSLGACSGQDVAPEISTVLTQNAAAALEGTEASPMVEGGETASSLSGSTVALQTSAAELSSEEAAGLLYMREEEKLAQDLYLALYERWGLPLFSNIADSEQVHTASVRALLEQFGLEDPAATMAPGEFQDPTLQSLYDQLFTQGSQSLAAALQVGALVEEVDIRDLNERILQTGHPQIEQVYSNLMAGSENHLRAFVQQYVSRTGEDYSAQVLDTRQVAAILADAPVRGRGHGPN